MKIKIAFVLLAVCMLFGGCGFDKPKCTVEIVTSYSGYGVDGQDLGSGTFTETFQAGEGDVFYETYYGNWLLNPENENKGEIIAEILKIEESGVNIILHGEETVVAYGAGCSVSSSIIIDDGPSYEYIMTVSEFSE